jgi:hypothetical protein
VAIANQSGPNNDNIPTPKAKVGRIDGAISAEVGRADVGLSLNVQKIVHIHPKSRSRRGKLQELVQGKLPDGDARVAGGCSPDIVE